jgi:acyl carrier protein
MNRDQAHTVIVDAMSRVAPEIDPADIGEHAELTEQLDLDSMDYLNWMLEIHRMTGIDIPERDYPRLMTIADATTYLVAATA